MAFALRLLSVFFLVLATTLAAPAPAPAPRNPSISTSGYPTLTNAFDHFSYNEEKAPRPASESTDAQMTYSDSSPDGRINRNYAGTSQSRSYKEDGASEYHHRQFFAEAGTATNGETGYARAGAATGIQALDGRGTVGRYFTRVATVGADAHAGVEDGVGVMGRATLAEVGGDLGGIAGAKVGLSADTGLSIGPNVEAKVLGTGFKVGATGVEVCFLGSCAWIG